jgi:DNA primase
MSLIQAVLIEHGYSGDELPDEDKWISILCPYHDETNPSARANPVLGAFVCHGCGRSGDCNKLVREQEELTYEGAQRRIAEIAADYGCELPSPAKRKSRRPRVSAEQRPDGNDYAGVRPRFRG